MSIDNPLVSKNGIGHKSEVSVENFILTFFAHFPLC